MKKGCAKKPPSIADVARWAGVSPATVSLVLNGKGRVAESTRQAVLKVIQERAYVPQAGGRPRGPQPEPGRTRQIAMVIAGPSRAMLRSPVYAEVLHEVEAWLAAKQYTLLIRHVCGNDALAGPLVPAQADGVLLFGSMDEGVLRRELRGRPTVHVMGHVAESCGYDHVSYDNGRIGELAAEHLLARGHRRAAFISGSSRRLFVERGDTFSRVFCAAGATSQTVVDDALIDATGSVQRVLPGRLSRVLDELFSRRSRPTALFLGADLLAQGVYVELQRRGIRPGEDVAVVSCNNEQQLLAHLNPQPATVDIHVEQVGRKAAEQLVWRMAHPSEPRVKMLLEPTLISEGGAEQDSSLGQATERVCVGA